MATADPIPGDYGEDNFILELERVKEQIKLKFTELVDRVKARETKVLKEIDTILATYVEYRNQSKGGEVRNKQQALEQTKSALEAQIKKFPVEGFYGDSLKQTEQELKSMRYISQPKMVHFVFEDEDILDKLKILGHLAQNKFIDYMDKVDPIVSVCDRGKELNQLNDPWGVAIDSRTGLIYVADTSNHCVKVFDHSGLFMFKFGDSGWDGKMQDPRCLAISVDRIFISHVYEHLMLNQHNILIYELDGKYVTKIGKKGDDNLEFNFPCGLACNESNGDIYICDSFNDRIQILSNKLKFKSQFAVHNPRDIKLSKDNIYILDESNPCLHLYSYDLILQKSVISSGNGMQVVYPYCFFVEKSKNFFISDHDSNHIAIFNPEFELIHKIKTSKYPMGVVVDNNGNIMVVCSTERDCLQIF